MATSLIQILHEDTGDEQDIRKLCRTAYSLLSPDKKIFFSGAYASWLLSSVVRWYKISLVSCAIQNYMNIWLYMYLCSVLSSPSTSCLNKNSPKTIKMNH